MALEFDRQRMKQIREQRGISQRALGREVAGHGPQAGLWERGRFTPTLETIGKIADALGVEYTELITKTEEAA